MRFITNHHKHDVIDINESPNYTLYEIKYIEFYRNMS